jgi:hypothetical protein
MWEAWFDTPDGTPDGVVTWRDCHLLADLLPIFLDNLRSLAIKLEAT